MAKDSTNIYMKKEDALICRMEASMLGYSSPAELINALIALRKSNKWSKLDVEILPAYHRLPTIEILTESELLAKGYKKVSEFTEPVKKKTRKTKKKTEEPQYFKGISKPKTEG